MKVKESLNVTFDETPSPPKTSPLEDDDLVEEEAIEVGKTRTLGNDLEDKSLENNKIINIKESKSHPLENVIARLESIRILLAYSCAQDFRLFQMDVKSAFLNGFINEEIYVAQPPRFIDFAKPNHAYRLKKALYGLKQAPKAWIPKPLTLRRLNVSSDTLKGLWYPKGPDIETILYVDSDHVEDYVDRKSTSGICTFMGCCLTSWFLKKQTTLSISTTEAEYVSTRKACQQALWTKQALIDYGIRLANIPIMCDNKEAIDLSKNPVQHSHTKYIEIRQQFPS
nr:retrovirus-related Pol polyprotein from transposon TNT 1-94 [Tanacetum cinerariifolium]